MNELPIVPEVAVRVAFRLLPAAMVDELSAREVTSGDTTLTFTLFMYALPSLSHSLTTMA